MSAWEPQSNRVMSDFYAPSLWVFLLFLCFRIFQACIADVWRHFFLDLILRMKVTCVTRIAVLYHFYASCAAQLGSMKITVQTAKYEPCQQCLLEEAGAVHVEEYEGARRGGTSYFLLGLIDYIKTNLIKCSATYQCRGYKGEPIVFENKEEEQLIFGHINEKQLASNSVGSQTGGKIPLLLSNDYASQTTSMISGRVAKPVCLYRPDKFHSSLCETCFKQKSDTRSMEKYAMYNMGISSVYVIYTSDTNVFLRSCRNLRMCRGKTVVFSENLCTLFRHKISSRKLQQETASMLPQVDTIIGNIKIWPPTLSKSIEIEKSEAELRAILFQSYCISTTASYIGNHNCWAGLQKQSGGMVVLDRIETFRTPEKQGEFLLYLFTNGPPDAVLANIQYCGEAKFSDHCMLDAVHVDTLTPTHDIFEIMERKKPGQQGKLAPNLHGECFLLQHLYDDESKCRAFFPESWKHKLSAIAFLVSFYADTNGHFNLKSSLFRDTHCKGVDLMPDAICLYELDRIKFKSDLNLRPQELTSTSGSDHSEASFAEAKVTLYKWTDKGMDNEDGMKDCFQCLTRKRNIVVLSVTNQYVWMVEYKMDFPNCPSCADKVKPGPQIPYDHNLRQILARDVNLLFGIGEVKKSRKRSK